MPEVQLRMIQVCRVLACGCSILTLYLPHQPPHRPIVLKTKEFVVGKELFETGKELKATMPWVLEYIAIPMGNEWRQLVLPLCSGCRLGEVGSWKTSLKLMKVFSELGIQCQLYPNLLSLANTFFFAFKYMFILLTASCTITILCP